MSENLSNFLVDLAADPDRMARFASNPAMALDGAGLTADEKAAILTQKSGRIAKALGVAADETPPVIDLEITPLEAPAPRRAPARRAPSRKKPPTRKGPARRKAPSKKRAPAKRRGPAKRKAPARKKAGRTSRKKK